MPAAKKKCVAWRTATQCTLQVSARVTLVSVITREAGMLRTEDGENGSSLYGKGDRGMKGRIGLAGLDWTGCKEASWVHRRSERKRSTALAEVGARARERAEYTGEGESGGEIRIRTVDGDAHRTDTNDPWRDDEHLCWPCCASLIQSSLSNTTSSHRCHRYAGAGGR